MPRTNRNTPNSGMAIVVLDRLSCEALPEAPQRAFISITNPRQAPAVLSAQWLLRLGFHDVEAPLQGFIAMQEQHAREIFDFLERLPNNTQELIIHCEHGASRSSAVGLFISRWLDAPLSWKGNGAPNFWVLRCLKRHAFRRYFLKPTLWPRLHRVHRLQ